MDHPGYSRGPAGLRGADPDPRRGGGDCTSYHGSRGAIFQSTDTGGRADRDPAGGPGSDPRAQCCNNTVTNRLPETGGHVRADTAIFRGTTDGSPADGLRSTVAPKSSGWVARPLHRYWLSWTTGQTPKPGAIYGTPVLGYALLTFGSNFEIVRLLLEAGADPNAQDDSGSTPLHIAVQIAAYASRPEAPARFSGNTDDSLENIYATIELLLQHGADAATRDNHGQSALLLYLANLIESESYNADPEIVKLLLEHGTEVTAENDTDAMVMTYAMWAGANPEVIRLLLEHGDQAAFRGHDGDTLLHMAAGLHGEPSSL